VNAIAFIGASQFAASLGGRFGMGRVVTVATSLYALGAVTLLLLRSQASTAWPAHDHAGRHFRLSRPGDPARPMVLALEEHGPIAGMASAFGGTLQMLTAAS